MLSAPRVLAVQPTVAVPPQVDGLAAPLSRPAADSFELGALELGAVRCSARPAPSATTAALQLRGGADDLAACCIGSGSGIFAWMGGTLGFALPLAVGIENLIAKPSVFNPSGEQHIGLGVAMVVCGATVFPAVGSVAGGLLGAALCGAPFLCARGRP